MEKLNNIILYIIIAMIIGILIGLLTGCVRNNPIDRVIEVECNRTITTISMVGVIQTELTYTWQCINDTFNLTYKADPTVNVTVTERFINDSL